ncbi:four-carbon acid sugar kinase family protein [Niabella insulamsoli]|uniref:four-carbon acid sugar kinase family protein n=1 Tax=Niabella insulamsoli TaxID=3144874 RepID=UPI0031FC4613
MQSKAQIQLAFYGDDFTGSTDALEFISRAGAKAVLFIEPPSENELNAFPGLQAYGVAGKTRALPTDQVEQALNAAFTKMKAGAPKHVHYKVCSTFDSSETIGSIGRAIDVGSEIFGTGVVPIVGGTPELGRYCVFGNLFARMGIGSNGDIFRLDRHPSMSKHPVTPANESDLRLHLQKQTKKRIGLIDVLQLEKEVDNWNEAIDGTEAVLIDALYNEQLLKIGEWLEKEAIGDKTLFSVGSSAVEMAIGSFWNRKGLLSAKDGWAEPGKAEPLLVLSGSYSPVTAGQIKWALDNGFVEVALEEENFGTNEANGFGVTCDISTVLSSIHRGKNVIVHSRNIKSGPTAIDSYALGRLLGTVGEKVCEATSLKRIVVAGGDTSSYAARAMGIEAVEMIAPLVSGAPLCKAFSKNIAINGMEVNFKGGQVGGEDYFGVLLEGKLRK